MKTALTMTAAVLAFALAAPVYAQSPQTVPGTGVEGNPKENSPGALTAPEANKSNPSSPGGSSMSDDPAANIPGTAAEGDRSEKNPTLSGADEPAGLQAAVTRRARQQTSPVPRLRGIALNKIRAFRALRRIRCKIAFLRIMRRRGVRRLFLWAWSVQGASCGEAVGCRATTDPSSMIQARRAGYSWSASSRLLTSSAMKVKSSVSIVSLGRW
jgi:hypothetical protein